MQGRGHGKSRRGGPADAEGFLQRMSELLVSEAREAAAKSPESLNAAPVTCGLVALGVAAGTSSATGERRGSCDMCPCHSRMAVLCCPQLVLLC